MSVNESVGFSYTGTVKGVTLKKAGYYKLEVWGAQGGEGMCGVQTQSYIYGGYGGYSFGKYQASLNSVIYVVVGQKGLTPSYADRGKYVSGGYNGGGYGGTMSRSNDPWSGGSGGGATHIATRSGLLSSLSSGNSHVLIVAGGGGGGSEGSGCSGQQKGGNGGGFEGGYGVTSNYSVGYGGTQSQYGNNSNYSSCSNGNVVGGFGYGGYVGWEYPNAGGGGGWYGGGGACMGGGGGGSGYIGNSSLLADKGMYQYSGGAGGCSASSAAATKTTCTTSTGAHVANAANTGNGYAKITYLGT